MDKQKQIEELVNAIQIGGCIDNDRVDCGSCLYQGIIDKNNNAPSCIDYYKANRLYDAGYRKIPSDAVVLTREEFENFGKDCKNCPYALDWYKETLRKETAREILLAIGKANNSNERYVTWSELCKRYGVEVEE